MGITKSNLFTEEQNNISTIAKAIGHPARVAIIQYLIKANACINGDFVQELGLAQATVSQHLRELKDIGIIQGSIEGSRVSYCIDKSRWKEIQGYFNGLFEELDTTGCC